MKINVFSYVFWPEEFLINEFVESLSSSHEVNVLTGLPNYPKGDFFQGYGVLKGPYYQVYKRSVIYRYPVVPRGRSLKGLALNYFTHTLGASLRQMYLPKADWAFVFATSPILTCLPAILWAKLKGGKVCIWLQDLWPESLSATGAFAPQSLIFKLVGHIVRWIYKNVDLILLQSPSFEANLDRYGYRGPRHVLYNWASNDFSENAGLADWLVIKDSSQFIITFAGNVGKAQSLDTMIKAAQILVDQKNIVFYVVGDGSELPAARRLSESLGLKNIVFWGRRPAADMPQLFKKSHALLVTLKNEEIFSRTIPSKIQSYMAAGRPILASINGVGRQIVETSGAGLGSPAEDAKILAENILKLSQMTEIQRRMMGEKGQAFYLENFQREQVLKIALDYLERYK